MAKKKSQAKAKAEDQLSFEEALKRLEEIVHMLEEGQIGLNEALARYEEGVKLLRQSFDLLQRAERRIELLSGVDAEGNPITRPFDDEATLAAGEKSHQTRQSGGAKRGRSRQSQAEETGIDAPGGLS